MIKEINKKLDKFNLHISKEDDIYNVTRRGRIFPEYRIEKIDGIIVDKYILKDIKFKKTYEHLITIENCVRLIIDFEKLASKNKDKEMERVKKGGKIDPTRKWLDRVKDEAEKEEKKKNEEVNNFEEFFTTNEEYKKWWENDGWIGSMGVSAANLQEILDDINKRLEILEG